MDAKGTMGWVKTVVPILSAGVLTGVEGSDQVVIEAHFADLRQLSSVNMVIGILPSAIAAHAGCGQSDKLQNPTAAAASLHVGVSHTLISQILKPEQDPTDSGNIPLAHK